MTNMKLCLQKRRSYRFDISDREESVTFLVGAGAVASAQNISADGLGVLAGNGTELPAMGQLFFRGQLSSFRLIHQRPFDQSQTLFGLELLHQRDEAEQIAYLSGQWYGAASCSIVGGSNPGAVGLLTLALATLVALVLMLDLFSDLSSSREGIAEVTRGFDSIRSANSEIFGRVADAGPRVLASDSRANPAPSSVALTASMTYVDWTRGGLRRVDQLVARGQYEAALNACEELLQGDSHNSHFWHRHGTTLALLERPAEAIASLRRAVQIAPEDADYCIELARELREHDGIDAAIAELQRGAQAATVLSQKRRLRQMIAKYQSEAQSTHHS